MHVGMSMQFQNLEEGRSDADLWQGQLDLALQAEPKGFDSIWTAEHHFTNYILSPSPSQFLTYMAARTNRIKLGSHVFVLPWHNPVRLAEELAVLDIVSHGRLVIGLGRGLGAVEFDGFGIDMGESRQRFVEYAQALSEGLESGVMSFDGELYKQPRVEIRPRPHLSFHGRTFASAVSPESALIMARLGFGLMIIAQKPWDTTIAEVTSYRELFREVNGCEPPRPLMVNYTSIHEDAGAAREIRDTYGIEYSRSAAQHYDFTNERLATIPGYEYYAALRKGIEKRGMDSFVRFLAELQISGTPEEVFEQTVERVRLVDAAAVMNVFSFGGMPDHIAQASVDLYAEQVLPRLKAFEPDREIGSLPAAITASVS